MNHFFFVSWNSSLGSVGRFFKSDGTPNGDQFTINTGIRPVSANLDQSTIAVASSRNYSIRLSIIPIDDVNSISQVIIADDSDGRVKYDPRITNLPEGGFAVVWGEYDQISNKYTISCKIFDAQGQSTSDELQFISNSSVNATRPSLLSLSNNDILIVWSENIAGDENKLLAQRISSSGVPYGEPSIIAYDNNYEDINLVGDKSIVETSDGNLSLVWTKSGGSDGSGNAVMLKGISFNQMTDSQESVTTKLRIDDDGYIVNIDNLIEDLSGLRSYIGATNNRLGFAVSNNTNLSNNLSISMSRIIDADYALETTTWVKNEIIQKASLAVLAQANASKSSVLQLILDT